MNQAARRLRELGERVFEGEIVSGALRYRNDHGSSKRSIRESYSPAP